ncbi:conjugal transfer protein TraR [Noviherbaspirillum cavernae]|uniref:Conjugal transfer protein TraR n=1 Tax=Noviherbaspirillum cavernae TaxID=2320862 RepID=A0A418X233_9BURK|nr:conjugal transfer protein TraR [Noviherbaspirillum cavernae]
MADEIDLAQDREEIARVDAIRRATKPLEPGMPGECDLCGEWSGRLVRGACAPCRDKWRLP